MFNHLATKANKSPEPPSTHAGTPPTRRAPNSHCCPSLHISLIPRSRLRCMTFLTSLTKAYSRRAWVGFDETAQPTAQAFCRDRPMRTS